MTAVRPPARPLESGSVRLRLLTPDDLPALFSAIGHPIVFAGGYGGGPAGYRDTEAEFVEFARPYYRWDDGLVYAVVIVGGPHDGELVGTTTLGDIDLASESLQLGWTAYDPRVWGTVVNAQTKRLLLGTAFEHGFGRVLIQADARNERSRAAIHRIGATFEGVARRHKPRADGSWRDSAVFSVIVDDWPEVSALLDERIAAHAGHPVFFRDPPSIGWRAG
jgi:RimJ/RimL family protein N-acetyltransferase